MKPLLAIAAAMLLASCTDTAPQGAYYTGPNYPTAAYETRGSLHVGTPAVYVGWSTAQLQERRKELYSTIPRRGLPNGDVAYVTSGQPLPQQDELKLVEAELNRRYEKGDKAAMLERFWPRYRVHPGSLGD